ncbi:MAG: PQQ-dependent sugar dehydrogenase [Ginsengibacter sp.]
MKLLLCFAIFLCFTIFTINSFGQKLAEIPLVSGINSPIDIKHCGDDRLFVADRAGKIRVINSDGTLRTTPFLDISSKISSATSGEEGFLGIVFSPDYKANGKFYVDYTSNIAGQLTSVVEEYKVSADSNVANPASSLTLLTQAQPYNNHNGGNLMFGKDGYLYIDFGDGGSGGDPQGNGQNTTTFLAKILRIDVSNSSAASPYAVPPTNPFYSNATPGIKKEIWAYGVRNPWRGSVDRLTGDLWIADVGQDAVEEIDFQAAGALGGRNYGWNIMEGNQCYNPSTGCNTAGLTMPIFTYTHAIGNSIIGGYVYRSAQSKELFGTYIFADYVKKWVDGIKQSGGTLSGPVIHLITNAQALGNPVSLGEDRYGDQYILFNGNTTVYKLEDTSYLRHPKAYFTTIPQGGGIYEFQALEGRNITYQWLQNNAPINGAITSTYSTSADGSYKLVVTNSLGNKDTSDAYVLGVLPLSLVSLDAQRTANGIRLNWTTSSEQNMDGFSVQKYLSSGNYEDINYIKSKSINGNSSSVIHYSFTDANAIVSLRNAYRLKITNRDASISFSKVVYVEGQSLDAYTIFPNPAKDYFNVLIKNYTHPISLAIFDNLGKVVKRQKIESANTEVDVHGLKGLYFIRIYDNEIGKITRSKIVIE